LPLVESLGFASLGFASLGFESLGFESLGFESLGFESRGRAELAGAIGAVVGFSGRAPKMLKFNGNFNAGGLLAGL
jgi:hypothetical protein